MARRLRYFLRKLNSFFSGRWCGSCLQFAPQLVETYKSVYNEVKHKFDIVFISSDRDQGSFDNFYSGMPWKALPFAGESTFLEKTIKISLIIQRVPSFIQTNLLLASSGLRFFCYFILAFLNMFHEHGENSLNISLPSLHQKIASHPFSSYLRDDKRTESSFY